MVLATLVPEANYAGRVTAWMQKFTAAGSLVDLPNPMLQNVGNEPIMQTELDPLIDFSDSTAVFGYVPRYTWHKTAVNEVHGLLQTGGSLESLSLNGSSVLSHRFLLISFRFRLLTLTTLLRLLQNFRSMVVGLILIFSISVPCLLRSMLFLRFKTLLMSTVLTFIFRITVQRLINYGRYCKGYAFV